MANVPPYSQNTINTLNNTIDNLNSPGTSYPLTKYPAVPTYSVGDGLSASYLADAGTMPWTGYGSGTSDPSFLDKAGDYLTDGMWKPNNEVTQIRNPDGSISTKTVNGGMLSTDAAKIGQGLYAVGMDGFNIYNTNRNYTLQKDRINLLKKEAKANYGLSAKKFNNAIADKNAARAAAKASGFNVQGVNYDTAATTL